MKKTILLIMLLLITMMTFLAGCRPAQDEGGGNIVEKISQCDHMSDGPRKLMCFAIEAKKIEMCEPVVGRFRDSCVVGVAEVGDGPVSGCDLAQSEVNQKLCRALITQDVDKCFEWSKGIGSMGGIAVRDCIDLVARKTGNTSVCDLHSSRAQEIYEICGKTQGCENDFLLAGADNAINCKENIQV